jgi:uncharacterized protein (TIGR03435 family)
VASVKSAERAGRQSAVEVERAFTGAGGRVNLRGVNLGYLLTRAFGIQPDQVEGPSWLFSQFFDIAAVAPLDTPTEKVLVMFQRSLLDRFGLKYHRENAIRAVYARGIAADRRRAHTIRHLPAEHRGSSEPLRFSGHLDAGLAQYLSQVGRAVLGAPVVGLTCDAAE